MRSKVQAACILRTVVREWNLDPLPGSSSQAVHCKNNNFPTGNVKWTEAGLHLIRGAQVKMSNSSTMCIKRIYSKPLWLSWNVLYQKGLRGDRWMCLGCRCKRNREGINNIFSFFFFLILIFCFWILSKYFMNINWFHLPFQIFILLSSFLLAFSFFFCCPFSSFLPLSSL